MFIRFITLMLVVLCSCSKHNTLTQKDYYGLLKAGDNTHRLYLKYDREATQLFIIGFRGYGIPIHKVSFRKGTLKFQRQDFYSEFSGEYNDQNGSITGNWIFEDSSAVPVTFVPVVPDTIRGFNPRTTKHYRYESPPEFDDQILVGNRMDHGMNGVLLDSLVYEIMRSRYEYVHSMLIARNNHLVVEEYFYGYRRQAHFGVQSVTKSLVSALTGIAISKGEIQGTATPLCNYIPDYKDLICNEQNRSITLKEVLSMSTGLAWDEISYEYGHEKNSAMIAANTQDEFRYLLSRPRSDKPLFAYNSLNHIMMNRVLQEATGLDNATEIRTRLLDPLGITEYDLGDSNNGVLGDIFLRPRDMLKFGLLFLHDGIWAGQQIVPKEWVQESTSTKIQVKPGLGYAYFWWTKMFPWKNKMVHCYFAWGYGGQYIFVVPELALVAVFNGTNWSMDPEKYYMEIMEQFVIGACE